MYCWVQLESSNYSGPTRVATLRILSYLLRSLGEVFALGRDDVLSMFFPCLICSLNCYYPTKWHTLCISSYSCVWFYILFGESVILIWLSAYGQLLSTITEIMKLEKYFPMCYSHVALSLIYHSHKQWCFHFISLCHSTQLIFCFWINAMRTWVTSHAPSHRFHLNSRIFLITQSLQHYLILQQMYVAK